MSQISAAGSPSLRSIRLKLHLQLENEAGQRVAELNYEQPFQDLRTDYALHQAEESMQDSLVVQVLWPARALLRGYVGELLKKTECQSAAVRLDRAGMGRPPQWPKDTEVAAGLERLLSAMHRQTREAMDGEPGK